MKGTIKEIGNSEIEIIGEIDAEKFSSYKQKAINSLGKSIKMDGFRQGHIPEEIIVKNLGEMMVLEEMAEFALKDLYPEFIKNNNIEAIGRPSISITKIAKDNPLEFKITTAVMPKIGVINYKDASSQTWKELEKESTEATQEEVDKVIDEIRKSRKAKKDHACQDENCKKTHPTPENITEEETLPELNDEFARSIGSFKDLQDLKEKIKNNLKQEKEANKREKGRTLIMDKIIADTKFDVPKILITEEQKQILEEVKGKIEQLGIKFEEYLKQINKTEDDIIKESEEPAKKRVQYKMILKSIARNEKIEIPEEKVLEEVEKLMKYYEKADFNSAKIYIEDVMANEKVFELLDNSK